MSLNSEIGRTIGIWNMLISSLFPINSNDSRSEDIALTLKCSFRNLKCPLKKLRDAGIVVAIKNFFFIFDIQIDYISINSGTTTFFALMIIVPQLSPKPKEEHSILTGLSPRIGSAIRVTISDGMLAPPRLPNSSRS